jgi:hypothetical protein
VIASVSRPYAFIEAPDQSPFNVGLRFNLREFSSQQVHLLNAACGAPLIAQQVDELRNLVGGHPFLLRRGFYEVSRGVTLDSLVGRAARDDGPFADHLRRLLMVVHADPALKESVIGALSGRGVATLAHLDRLVRAGIFVGGTLSSARPSCRLYDDYLRTHLLASSG